MNCSFRDYITIKEKNKRNYGSATVHASDSFPWYLMTATLQVSSLDRRQNTIGCQILPTKTVFTEEKIWSICHSLRQINLSRYKQLKFSNSFPNSLFSKFYADSCLLFLERISTKSFTISVSCFLEVLN